MARDLQITIESVSYSLSPVKVDRKKIYGWTDLRVKDANGNECRQVGLDSNGVTIIPSGAIKMGIVGENGCWIDTSELVAVHANGEKAELCPSSFDSGIVLDKKVSAEEFLDTLVTSIYVLNGEKEEELAKIIGNDIYSFRFNYRTDYEDSLAFMISNGASAFIVVGQKAKFEFLSLEDQQVLDMSEDGDDEFDFDDLDFNMM